MSSYHADFICTYKLMDNDDDRNIMYQIQILQAFGMQNFDQDEINEKVLHLYQKLIDKGVSRETARDVLPLSTETTMYMKGSIRSWIHYIELRCSIDTQLEHRQIAEGIKSIFVNEFPNITEAIGWKTN